MKPKFFKILTILSIALVFSACTTGAGGETGDIQASGVVEAVEVAVASEMGGVVAEIYVAQGDPVQAGDALFRLDSALLNAQRDQALAARSSAEANLALVESALAAMRPSRAAAEMNVEAARLQLFQILQAALLAEQPARTAEWSLGQPDAIVLPPWYFDKEEEIAAAQAEVDAAEADLVSERENLAAVIQEISSTDLEAVESRLAAAQAAYRVAQDLLALPTDSGDAGAIDDYLQASFDAAEAELKAAQLAYDDLLSDQDAANLLEARGKTAVAEERHALALDRLNGLSTGSHSPAVLSATLLVQQAEVAVAQVDAGVEQATAAVEVARSALGEVTAAVNALDLQIEKLTVYAAFSGVILDRGIEPGEILPPGRTAFTIGLLDDLTITVYLPEDQYGLVSVGDGVTVTVDSFPGQEFDAVVTRISDQAEFTPRNVQTKEERVTTVFAIELRVDNVDSMLKPGMPADVVFGLP